MLCNYTINKCTHIQSECSHETNVSLRRHITPKFTQPQKYLLPVLTTMTPQCIRTWTAKLQRVEEQQMRNSKRRSDAIDQEIAAIRKLGRRYSDGQIVLIGACVSQCECCPGKKCQMNTSTGSALSGKSTSMRQIEILFKEGLSDGILIEHRPVIFRAVILSAQAVVRAMQGLQLDCLDRYNVACVQHIQSLHLDQSTPCLSPTTTDIIHQFWQDPVIPLVIRGHWKVVSFPDNAE